MLGGRAIIHDILNLVCRCFVGRSQIRVKALSRKNSRCVFELVLPLATTLVIYPVWSTLANFPLCFPVTHSSSFSSRAPLPEYS